MRARPRGQVDWTVFLRGVAICCLFGASIVHGVWTVLHFHEWVGAGLFFLTLAAAQTVGAFALVALPARHTYLAICAVSLGTVLVWAVSRTIGLPFGPEAGQSAPVGMPDLVASFFELMSILALLPLLPGSAAAGRRAARGGVLSPRACLALGIIAVYTLLLTCLAVVPAASGHGNGENSGGTSHDHANHSHG